MKMKPQKTKKQKRASRKGVPIKAHKGRRNKQRPAIFTEADDKTLRRHLKNIGDSFGDWLKRMIAIDCRPWCYSYELPGGEMQAPVQADSLGEAIETALYHAEGRRIIITSAVTDK